MSALARRRARLSQRFGKRIQGALLDELAQGGALAPSPLPLRARILALFILCTPFAVLACAIWLVAGHGLWLFGVLLFAIGGFLLPWRRRRKTEGLERKDAPETFAWLDGLSQAVGGRPVVRLVISPDFNAFMTQDKDGPVIGIGALLWALASDDEKLAVVAHELAHQVNGDPERTSLIAYALETLSRWHAMLGPEADGHYDSVTEMLFAPFALLVELVFERLIRMLYTDSQRAEYLADLKAAEVAGSVQMQRALEQVIDSALIEDALLRFAGSRLPEGREMLAAIAEEIRHLPQERVQAVRDKAAATGHSVDGTHPPTVERIAFLAAAPQHPPRHILSHEQVQKIEAELSKQLDRAGSQWSARLERQ